jgi:hypothetical protein
MLLVALGPIGGEKGFKDWNCSLYAIKEKLPVPPRLPAWKSGVLVTVTIVVPVALADHAPSANNEIAKPMQIDLAGIGIKSATVCLNWFVSRRMTFLAGLHSRFDPR